MNALILLTVVLTTAWMGTDASKRDWSTSTFANATWKWILGGFLLWIVVFPAYIFLRSRTPLKTALAGPAFAPAAAGPTSTDASGSIPPPGFRD